MGWAKFLVEKKSSFGYSQPQKTQFQSLSFGEFFLFQIMSLLRKDQTDKKDPLFLL